MPLWLGMLDKKNKQENFTSPLVEEGGHWNSVFNNDRNGLYGKDICLTY